MSGERVVTLGEAEAAALDALPEPAAEALAGRLLAAGRALEEGRARASRVAALAEELEAGLRDGFAPAAQALEASVERWAGPLAEARPDPRIRELLLEQGLTPDAADVAAAVVAGATRSMQEVAGRAWARVAAGQALRFAARAWAGAVAREVAATAAAAAPVEAPPPAPPPQAVSVSVVLPPEAVRVELPPAPAGPRRVEFTRDIGTGRITGAQVVEAASA